ncbi:unnamed protein product [Mytilus coruscus]|uniref:PHD-type domain-containing protein n=1 Tax=Mytilus coruscus TaxID=42192 RepID=A0A6J8A0H6_MYTCO|nr:unnamed protein product [Mytilus coruscus]
MSHTRRSYRTRNAPIAYTPTRPGTEIANSNTWRRFNEQSQDNIDTCNDIITNISNHINFDTVNKTDRKGLVVEEQLSIKNTNKKQQYRINCYNTSSRVLVNGNALELFMVNILPEVVDILSQNKSLDKLNSLIRQTCGKFLQHSTSGNGTSTTPSKYVKKNDNIIVKRANKSISSLETHSMKHKLSTTSDKFIINGLPTQSNTPTDSAGTQDNDSFAICPNCNTYCNNNAVECCICMYWFHYTCLNLLPNESKALESSKNPYTCRGCEHMQDFLDYEDSNTSIITSDKVTSNSEDALQSSANLKRGRPKKTFHSNTEIDTSSQTIQQNQTSCVELVPKNTTTQQNTEYVHRSELQNKENQLRSTEGKLSKTELDLNQAKKQLVTAKAFIAKLEDKCKDMEESNRIQKTKILLLEGIHDNSDGNLPKSNQFVQHQCSYNSNTNNPTLQMYEQRTRRLELENVRNACRMDSIENLVKIENLTSQINASKSNVSSITSQTGLNNATTPAFQPWNHEVPVVINHSCPVITTQNIDHAENRNTTEPAQSAMPEIITPSCNTAPANNTKMAETVKSDNTQSGQLPTLGLKNQTFLGKAQTIIKPPWEYNNPHTTTIMHTHQPPVVPMIYRQQQIVRQNQMIMANQPHLRQQVIRQQIPTNYVNLGWYPTTSRVSVPVNTNPISPLQRPRGLSGTAVCYRREIANSVTENQTVLCVSM